jgi:glycosyltransferase involved in cell wall biosynthesis
MTSHHIVLKATGSRFWMGGREYTRNLLRAISRAQAEESLDFKLSLMVDGHDELKHYEMFRSSLANFVESEAAQAPWSAVNRLRWRARRSLSGIDNPRLQEYLQSIGTTFAYPLITAPGQSQPFRSAAWIPDFQFKHFPTGAPPQEIAARQQDAQRIAETAQTIVLSSQHAERDCVELFPNCQGRTFVLRFRVSVEDSLWDADPWQTVGKYNLPKRYLLVSNLLAPTKNHNLVLKSLAVLAGSLPDLCVVFTGDLMDYRNPGFYNIFLAKIHELGVAAQVRVLGLIPKNDQFQLLRACQALLQPSLFEGWHTGVEEAHLIGKRILLSTIPVHVEQEPPHAHYFDPNDAQQLAEVIRQQWPTAVDFCRDYERAAVQAYSHKQAIYGRNFLKLAGVGE